MIEVQITNYESIDNIKITIDGFTALIGRNHIGKSAILRAINAALTNKEGTEFIKWGQKFCEVRIDIKEKNFYLLWHKEKNNSYYEINGKVYKKIGKSDVPKEITEIGFKPVIIGDQKIDLNYAVQFSPLFLVDKVGSKTTDLLTSVFDLDRLYRAISLCNAEQKDNSDLLRIREKDLKILKESIKPFENFPEILKTSEKLKNKKEQLEKGESELCKLKNYIEKIHTLNKELTKYSKIREIKIPNIEIIKNKIDNYTKLKKLYDNLQTYSKEFRRLEPITRLDSCRDKVMELISKKEEYLKIKQLSYKLNKLLSEIRAVEKVKNLQIPQHNIKIEDFLKLKEVFHKLITTKENLENIKIQIENLNTQIELTKNEIKNFKICPFCGSRLYE